jgi:hypothetical protein
MAASDRAGTSSGSVNPSRRRVEQLGQFVGLEAEQAEVVVGRLR